MQPPGSRCTAALAAAAALAACLAVVWATPGDAYWIVDCGNKALVAQRLLDSSYADASFDYPGARFDPERRFFPIPVPFALERGRERVSVFAPAYAALAAPALGLLGPRGLRLPAALGVAAIAGLFVLWAAPAVGRRAALAGALALALASPLFFYGVTVWEHAPSVALGLGAWTLLSREEPHRWAAAGALLGAACAIREDLSLMAAAVLLAALLRRRPARLWLPFAVGVALPAAGLLLFNQDFYGNPLGGHVALEPGAVGVPAALGGGAAVNRLTPIPGLLGGLGNGLGERWLLGLLGLGLPLVGFVAARRGVGTAWLAPALAAAGLAGWALGFARMLSAEVPLQALVLHNGLLLQWPMLCLAGLGTQRAWSEAEYAPLRTSLLAGLVFIALMLATGAAVPSNLGAHVGAGVHWGPRVLLPALPALALLAVAAVGGRERGAPAARAVWAALALAGVLSTLLSVWFLTHQKLDGERFANQLKALPPRVIVTFHPYLAQHLASLWHEKPTLLVQDWASVQQAAAGLRRAGERQFLFPVRAGTPVPVGLPGLACRVVAEHRGPRLHYLDLDVMLCGPAPRR